MARFAAFVFLACVVWLVQGADDVEQQQPMSVFFRKESGRKLSPSWGDSSRRDDDDWDQDTTTEYSSNQLATEESSWWHEPSNERVSFRQDFRGRRKNSPSRDSRRSQPWGQDSTTEDSWNEPATEESSWWSQSSTESSSIRQDSSQPSSWEDSWQQQIPKSQESWINAPHWNHEQQTWHETPVHAPNQMAPQTEDSWTETSWDVEPTEDEQSATEDSLKISQEESSRKPSFCYQRADRGTCQDRNTRYYYDKDTESCKTFVWSGCGGNQNRFKDREMCENTCGAETPRTPSRFRCKRDGYYKHPMTCTKFIQCANGIPYEQNCPSGLHFSLSTTTCESPCDAFCDQRLARECGWDSADLEVKQGYQCPYDGLFSNPDSCVTYVECKNNVPHVRRCPFDMHFNNQSMECEPPCRAHCDRSLACRCSWSECASGSKEADCYSSPDKGQCDVLSKRYFFDRNSNRCKQFYYRGCGGNGNNYRTMEECQKTCGSQQASEQYHCPRPNGYFGHMYDCTMYYQCENGQATMKRCPRGQWFDHMKQTCTSDESATCMYTCRQPNGMYAYLPDCEKYIRCSEGKPTVARCERGQAFSKQQRRCVPKSEVNCGYGPFNTTVSLQDSRAFRCPTPNGNYPKVDDCAKYWRCDHSIANEEDCETKYFNPETLECDDSQNVSCPAYEFGRKVICYFDNDTPSTRKFEPEDLSPYLCTHIHYAYARLETTGDSYSIASTHRENDIVLRYYERVINLKKYNQKLKVLLTLGGWKDSDSQKYSQLVADVAKWPAFIESVIQYLKQYGFDGLEFDWEFPVCRTSDCRGHTPSATEKQSFESFLEMLYSRLSAQKLLLSVRVSGQKKIFENAYKMEEIGNVADYIVVMAYIPPGESVADTVPPSILNKGRASGHMNEDASTIMALWKQKVQDPKKLILGVRADARVYQLKDATKTDIYSPISPYGTEPQDMAYSTVCSYLQSHDWNRGSSPQIADYIYQDTTWIGYQGPGNLRKFAEHVFRNSYGGVALIGNQSDDFKARCCHVKNPLLKGLVYGFTRKGLVPHDFGCP